MNWLEKVMTASWYRPIGLSWLLLPLLPISHWFVAKKRRQFLKSPPHAFPVPVIVVGNITVGGTGKSPIVMALHSLCQQHGWRVGIVSRGYGGRLDAPKLVSIDDSPQSVGDEPLMLFQRLGCPVCVYPDRKMAVEHLLAHHELDLIISDDGLQHYGLYRDLEIVMLDHLRKLGNGQLLPVGPLREPASRLKAVDYCLAIGCDSTIGEVIATGVELVPTELVGLDGACTLPLSALADGDWSIVAGIGNPQRFVNTLLALGMAPSAPQYLFADHHDFVSSDMPDQGKVVMTEKDAVKCRNLDIKHSEMWFLRIDARFSAELEESLLQSIKKLIREN